MQSVLFRKLGIGFLALTLLISGSLFNPIAASVPTPFEGK
jgi:hypothetical protein